jgi:peroxiredoxin
MTQTNDQSPGATARLPDLQLTLPDGRLIRLSDYHRDRSLVALFSGGAECGPCRHAIMSDLCSKPEEYEQAGATALVVLQCSSGEAELVRRREGLTLPVLVDPAGEACRAVGAQTPDGKPAVALVVTDCTGRIYLEGRPDREMPLPTREMIFSCLHNIPASGCTRQSK